VDKAKVPQTAHVGDSSKVDIKIIDVAGQGGSGIVTVKKTNSGGTSTIFSGPFSVSPGAATGVKVPYTYVSADVPNVTFQTCISADSNNSNNCKSESTAVSAGGD